jgi:hypothetical protein
MPCQLYIDVLKLRLHNTVSNYALSVVQRFISLLVIYLLVIIILSLPSDINILNNFILYSRPVQRVEHDFWSIS